MRAPLGIAVIIACLGATPAWAEDKTDPPKPAAEKAAIDASELESPPPEYNTVVLQGLNKVTGHVSKLDGPVGTVMRFGNLEIVTHRCWKSSPEERPENAALLEISELKPGEPPVRIFLGWMFSSSPGLSGLEHPVYDVNVLSCAISKDPEKPDATAKADKADKVEKTDKPAKAAKPKKAH